MEADRHRVVITRGPLLYSAEGIDNGGNVERFYFDGNPDTTRAIVSRMEAGPLAGLPGVELPAHEKTLKATQVRTLKLIPYFAWSNRDRGSMATWIPTDANLARIDFGARENLKFAGVSASHTYEGDTVDAIRMKHTPSSSFDTSIRRWTGWPQRGRPPHDPGGSRPARRG